MTRIPDDGLVATLRRSFDESFAKSPVAELDHLESFLGLGINGSSFAIRTRDVAELLSDRKIVALPTPVAAFSGLIAHRGALVPIFDLGILLGNATPVAARWIVLAKARDAISGFCFDRFDGHFRVAGEAPATRELLYSVAGLPSSRTAINLEALLDSIVDIWKGALPR